jgi:hypothetical protein
MEYDDYPEHEPPPRDTVIDDALVRVMQVFEQQSSRVFYSTQIETQLEREFFHWITNKALLELGNAGRVQRMPAVVHGRTVNFYAHTKYRYWKREQKRLQALLERIFDPEFTHAIGRHAEMMFDSALSRHGFMLTPNRDVKSWNGKAWTETNHNLDRIAIRDGIAYGIEIKNTQNYIQRDELHTKLRLCAHLGLVPLFIMRAAPKSYMYEIGVKSKGFGLLFEEQIYPWGHSTLLTEVRDQLGLKVQSPRDIKDGDMQRLVNWHLKRLPKS